MIIIIIKKIIMIITKRTGMGRVLRHEHLQMFGRKFKTNVSNFHCENLNYLM